MRGWKHAPVWTTKLLWISGSAVSIAPPGSTLPTKVSPNIQTVRPSGRLTGIAPSAEAHSV